MGAMHNDLERCTYMFSNDRRCRNLIHTPDSPFCFFHANRGRKKPKPGAQDAAMRELFRWLAAHPLDSVTHVNQAVNLVVLLQAGGRISVRRADSLLRLLRVAMKSVPDVREEFIHRSRRRHWRQGRRFLDEVQPLLAAFAPEVAATPLDPPPSPHPAPDHSPSAAIPQPVPVSARRAGARPESASAAAPDGAPADCAPATARSAQKAAPHRVPAEELSRADIRSLIRAALSGAVSAAQEAESPAAHGAREPET
jgi:hypothetical protein